MQELVPAGSPVIARQGDSGERVAERGLVLVRLGTKVPWVGVAPSSRMSPVAVMMIDPLLRDVQLAVDRDARSVRRDVTVLQVVQTVTDHAQPAVGQRADAEYASAGLEEEIALTPTIRPSEVETEDVTATFATSFPGYAFGHRSRASVMSAAVSERPNGAFAAA